MYADKCSHLFWECLAEDISLGICKHSLFGTTAPANLLFWVDKVFRGKHVSSYIKFAILTSAPVTSGERVHVEMSGRQKQRERGRERKSGEEYRQ